MRVAGAETPIEPITSAAPIAERCRDAADIIQALTVVDGIAVGPDPGARLGQVRQRHARSCGVALERGRAVEGLQLRESEVGEQGLAVRRAMQRHQLAGLPGHDDALVAGGMVIDEEDFASFADGEVRGLSRSRRRAP